MIPSTLVGNYYTTFSIPTIAGIYTDFANCSIQMGTRTLYASKSSSFHVSPTLVLFNNISSQISQLNQTVVDGDNMLNNTINYVHTDILDNLNITGGSINSTLNQIINDMSTYYSNMVMITNNQTSTILNALGNLRSDIEIIQEWLDYMFTYLTGITRGTGEEWIDKIVGTDVSLPDWMIPRPN
jgi:hypothetical protein